jgi:two-component system nitrate/nitrite response regulator NarL
MGSPTLVAFIVGRCDLLSAGLSHLLQTAGFHVIGPRTNDWNTLSGSFEYNQALLLVVESSESNIDETVNEITLFIEKHPTGRVAVLSENRRAENILSAFQAGANVYLPCSIGPDAFLKTLELVMMGETILPPELLSLTLKTEADQLSIVPESEASMITADSDGGCVRLSSREDDILRCLAEGATNKAIAHRMNIAEATVKAHVKAILRKIRVQNRTQAAIWAVQNGLSALAEKPDTVVDLPVRSRGPHESGQ